jgi:hypothetical protein
MAGTSGGKTSTSRRNTGWCDSGWAGSAMDVVNENPPRQASRAGGARGWSTAGPETPRVAA